MSRVNVSLHAAHHVIRASRGVRQLVVDLVNVRFGNQHDLLFSPLTDRPIFRPFRGGNRGKQINDSISIDQGGFFADLSPCKGSRLTSCITSGLCFQCSKNKGGGLDFASGQTW